MDMIQSEYGWDDEQVFNLTLRRAIQIKESIEQRQAFRYWKDAKTLEWQTKTLGYLIANTVDSVEGRKALINSVQEVSILGGSAKSKFKGPKTYKLKATGEIIPANEIYKYRYEELDHTEEDELRREAVRAANRGKNIGGMF